MKNLKTVPSISSRKIKTIEVKYSNMSFIVQVYSHYCENLWQPHWSVTKYSAIIKETGKGIGVLGSRKLIKAQMELINSKPHLFL